MHDITLQYNGTPVVSGFSLGVTPGEAVCIHGPSGSGKSSLLHLAAGLIRPWKGSCRVNTTRIGYAFQEPPLLPWMTVEENVRFIAGRGDMARGGDAPLRLLEKMGLARHAESHPAQLSGGMKRRACIACALAAQADLILLDEPFASLDPEWQTRVADCIMAETAQRGVTLLMVSHQLAPLDGHELRRVGMV